MGLFLGFSGPLEASYLQRQVPENLRGRVFATYGGLRQILVPISMPIIGYYLEYIAPMKLVDGQVIMPNIMLYMGLMLIVVVVVYIAKFCAKN